MIALVFHNNLYEIIFHRHEHFQCDEFVVISGYVGPQPVQRTRELPIKTTVVYGMYASDGIHNSLHNSLRREENELSNLRILYSTIPVHSKVYIWLKSGKVVHSLIGSANFSINGLTTPNKEILAETNIDSFVPLESYKDLVLNSCISCAEGVPRQSAGQRAREAQRIDYDPEVCELPLYLEDQGVKTIPLASGINWGMARLTGSHVNINDAYIPIPADKADHYPLMFPAKQSNPINLDSVYREGHRHNDTVEVIWDDGKEMTVLLEGSRGRMDDFGNKIWYPKQIASCPSKAELGRYLRERLSIPEGQAITYADLTRYGRDTVSVSLQGEGIYYFDFSPRRSRVFADNVIYPASVGNEPVASVAERYTKSPENSTGSAVVSRSDSVPGVYDSQRIPTVNEGDTVRHKSFGYGTVREVHESYIKVSFDIGDKEFQIPNAFIAGYLSRV